MFVSLFTASLCSCVFVGDSQPFFYVWISVLPNNLDLMINILIMFWVSCFWTQSLNQPLNVSLILFSKLRTIGSSLHYQLYSVTTLRGCRLWPFILISSLYSTLFNSPVYLEITLKWFPLVYKFEPAAFNTVPGCFNSGTRLLELEVSKKSASQQISLSSLEDEADVLMFIQWRGTKKLQNYQRLIVSA